MRVLIVSQYFWPENFRINDLSAELVKKGHDVSVLTGVPNYPEGNVFEQYRNNRSKFSEFEACEVIRVPMVTRGKGSSVKLILNYFSFAFSASFFGAWKLRKQAFDVIFVFEPSPVTVGLPAVFLRKIKKAPVVFWVLDLWPETLESIGVIKSKKLLSLVGLLVSFIYNRCDLILGQSRAFLDGISLYTKNKQKIKYFPSWSENIFNTEKKSNKPVLDSEEEFFKVLFAGNVGEAQDFPAILQALDILKSKNANVKIFVVGDGRALEDTKKIVEERELDKYIAFLGRYPLEAMPGFYSVADALLVTLKESPVFSKTIPGKVQSYMMAGKPLLSMLSGEGSKVISEADCGYTASSGDYQMLADNILSMSTLSQQELTRLGENAKTYSNKEFNRDKLIDQLDDWFSEVVKAAKETGL